MVIITGWIAVQRGVWIDFNLEEYYLSIKTDSTLGSNDLVYMNLFNSQNKFVGYLNLHFTSTPQYKIWPCNADWPTFTNNLPPDNDKVWRITLTRTSGIRLVVHCNEEEVLNYLMSESTCSQGDWDYYLNREVAKIKFGSDDTASDYYQPQPGSCVF